MPTCLDSFCKSGLTGAELRVHIAVTHPSCKCENEICSPYSDGPVNDNEELAFLLIDPVHYDPETKTIAPIAFQEVVNRDLSVVRLSLAKADDLERTREALINSGLARLPVQNRQVEQICLAKTSDIRAIGSATTRSYAVYDTALSHSRSHASVFITTDIPDLPKIERQRLKYQIHKLFTARVQSFSEVLQGLQSNTDDD
jgi:hypothetical protein